MLLISPYISYFQIISLCLFFLFNFLFFLVFIIKLNLLLLLIVIIDIIIILLVYQNLSQISVLLASSNNLILSPLTPGVHKKATYT